MIYAVIDIGTNSTRLYAAEISKGVQRVLYKKLETTRLGEGGLDGLLKKAPMERTAQAAERFVQKAHSLGAAAVFIYATAAVREASNKEEFARLIKLKTGFELNIISGETEAYIAYLGAAGDKDGCTVIDIGGGSTEIIIKNGDMRSMSLKLGAVRLMENWGGGQLDEKTINRAVEYIDSALRQYEIISPRGSAELIGVSGTPTTIAGIKLGSPAYQPQLIQGLHLTLDEIRSTALSLCRKSLEERKRIPGMPPERADVLQYGALILWRFMAMYGYDKLTVSDDDSLKGYIKYMMLKGRIAQ